MAPYSRQESYPVCEFLFVSLQSPEISDLDVTVTERPLKTSQEDPYPELLITVISLTPFGETRAGTNIKRCFGTANDGS